MNEKVLIVEDDFDIQSILKNYLEDAGYQLVNSNSFCVKTTSVPSQNT